MKIPEILSRSFGKRFAVVALASFGLAGCAGGYYSAGYRTPIPPPPGNAYYQPASPGPGYYWRGGYYDYSGSNYAWVGGAWVRPPRARAVWVNPGWEGRRWRRGHWR